MLSDELANLADWVLAWPFRYEQMGPEAYGHLAHVLIKVVRTRSEVVDRLVVVLEILETLLDDVQRQRHGLDLVRHGGEFRAIGTPDALELIEPTLDLLQLSRNALQLLQPGQFGLDGPHLGPKLGRRHRPQALDGRSQQRELALNRRHPVEPRGDCLRGRGREDGRRRVVERRVDRIESILGGPRVRLVVEDARVFDSCAAPSHHRECFAPTATMQRVTVSYSSGVDQLRSGNLNFPNFQKSAMADSRPVFVPRDKRQAITTNTNTNTTTANASEEAPKAARSGTTSSARRRHVFGERPKKAAKLTVVQADHKPSAYLTNRAKQTAADKSKNRFKSRFNFDWDAAEDTTALAGSDPGC